MIDTFRRIKRILIQKDVSSFIKNPYLLFRFIELIHLNLIVYIELIEQIV